MRKYFLIILIVVAVAAVAALGVDENDKMLKKTFYLDATYYPNKNEVQIHYLDLSDNTNSATLEILGMKESFQKKFTESEFVEIVNFDSVPKHGWKIHPIVINIDHKDFGKVNLKTEIHEEGETKPQIIFGRP